MGTDVVQFSEAPKSLAPFVLPADAGTSQAPAPVADVAARRAKRSIRDRLSKVGWLFPFPTMFSGIFGFTFIGASFLTSDMSMIPIAVVSAVAFLPMLGLTITSDAGTSALRDEDIWLRKAAQESVTNWLLKELGADAFYVHVDYNDDKYDTDIVRFVNDRAAGHLKFGIVAGGGWNLWREVDGGPITTDYQKRAQPVKAVVRALTEPQEREKPRRTIGQPEPVAAAEMFDRDGRRLLARAETLLGMLAGIKDAEQAHRIGRAADIFKDVLALAQQAAVLNPAARRRAMRHIGLSLADAVRELEAVWVWHETQVERNAQILATYTEQVTHRPGPDGFRLDQ